MRAIGLWFLYFYFRVTTCIRHFSFAFASYPYYSPCFRSPCLVLFALYPYYSPCFRLPRLVFLCPRHLSYTCVHICFASCSYFSPRFSFASCLPGANSHTRYRSSYFCSPGASSHTRNHGIRPNGRAFLVFVLVLVCSSPLVLVCSRPRMFLAPRMFSVLVPLLHICNWVLSVAASAKSASVL